MRADGGKWMKDGGDFGPSFLYIFGIEQLE